MKNKWISPLDMSKVSGYVGRKWSCNCSTKDSYIVFSGNTEIKFNALLDSWNGIR